jgi:hypothetical protein
MNKPIENTDLTNALRERNDSGLPQPVEIMSKLGEGMYSVSYRGHVNGWLKTIRFFKLLGPNDQLAFKRNNIVKEATALAQLEQKRVDKVLWVSSRVNLRHIEYTGPKVDGEPVFWEKNPIIHNGDTYVGYQICDYISGTSLAQIHEPRLNPVFVKAIGDQFGRVLTAFHYAARDVTFPVYTTPEELGKNDHAYRHVQLVLARTEAAALSNPERQSHYDVARKLNAELLPLYAPDTLPSLSRPIHGDLNLGNILIDQGRITGIVDWDKARQSIPEYDFRGIALIPGMLDVAADRYELAHYDLGMDFKVNKALVCKLGLCVHLTAANIPSNPETTIAENIVAADILLEQLAKLEPDYTPFHTALHPQADSLRKARPGIELMVT